MRIFTCRSMRAAVIGAGLLFVLGVLLQIPAILLSFQPLFTPAYMSYAGLLAMLLSPVVLLLTAVVAALPGVGEKLRACQH